MDEEEEKEIRNLLKELLMSCNSIKLTTSWRLMAVAAQQFLLHFFFLFVLPGLT
jgi:hypothetical protein